MNYDMDNAGDVFSHTSAMHYAFESVTGEKSPNYSVRDRRSQFKQELIEP